MTMTLGIASGNPPLVSLGAWARVMQFRPVGSFMGIIYPGACETVGTDKRNTYVQAAFSGLTMMQDWLMRQKISLYDRQIDLAARAPYFSLDETLLPVTTDVRRIDGTVTPPVDGNPDALASIAGTLVLATGETLAGVTAIFPSPALAARLGAEIVSTSLTGDALTVQVRAYNLVDLDAIPETGAPVDDVPYLSSVSLDCSVRIAAVPTAHWDPDPCARPGQECVETTSVGCLYPTLNNIVEVRNYRAQCIRRDKPDRFTMSVTRTGLWRDSLADALTSLMNTRISVDFALCSPVANARYRDDCGQTELYKKTYPYAFANPFGILMPGAQYAWKQLELFVSNTRVIRM